jgi:hypothetical protein
MNISEAKKISIVEYLKQIGYSPVKIRNGQYWYLSPLREETTPSFKVNERLGEWYDFGIAEGGDLIELGKRMYNTNDIHTVLTMIERDSNGLVKEKRQEVRSTYTSVEDDMIDMRVMPLRNYALTSYLQSRGVDIGIATAFCKEIHYILRQKKYFAIAFPNKSGGFEVRNPYYKGCIKNKDVSVFYHTNGMTQEHICVFEGFMDFLSYMTLRKKGNTEICVDGMVDVLVMNSVANLRKSMDYLDPYKEIHCYLDNDIAGQKTVETFVGLFGEKVKDESARYREYKDLNDLLRGKKR